MPSRKVVLIGWDAADWKVIRPLMAAGKMPNVQRMVDGGSSGDIATLHPPLSPMLWTSIATGKRPFKHGILGFAEPAPAGRGVQPVTNLSRKTKALWNILQQNGLRSVVTGWWPSHPAEPIDGAMVSDHFHRASKPLDQGWPLRPNTVHPPELAETLAALRVHPETLTPEQVEPFIPLAREIDQEKDNRLALFLRTLAECMTVDAAANWLIENQSWDFFAVYYDAIDHFSHGFMKYHPPRQFWIGERDFDLYQNVVTAAYEFHDRMLGRLVEKAGADAIVILMSDHGFHPDHLRPGSIPDVPAGPAVEHRDYGILAMSGPGIVKNQRLDGASVLDVTPTILGLYGLPLGQDMDGKVLSQAFEWKPSAETIPSWEDMIGVDGRHPAHTQLDPIAAHEAMEQMIALGYIQRPDANREVAIAQTVRELKFNLGEAYQDADRHQEAHTILAELHAESPSDERYAVRLFVSSQALGMIEEMRSIAGSLSNPELAAYFTAEVLVLEKRYAEALEMLEGTPHPLKIADVYFRLCRFQDAQAACEAALEADPDNAHAHVMLARIALRRRRFDAAAHSALDAIARRYQYALAHYVLGLALTGMKDHERAAEAFRAALSFNPNFPEARRRLKLTVDSVPSLASAKPVPVVERAPAQLPSLDQCLTVVTGLPRSGTSMLMQMLAAGGLNILSDGVREPDEDNPRGYFEFEPVKNLPADSSWLSAALGKAVKIVVPLLAAIPAELPCRVILAERDLDEVLDSQQRMLLRRNEPLPTLERRRSLKDEYERTLARVKLMLAERPLTQVLIVQHRDAIAEPERIAQIVSDFLGGGLHHKEMARAISPELHRNRA